MGKIVFVEILDRRGSVRERVKVDSFPAVVGRGYTNALILDDPLVSVEHLKLSLDEEGTLVLEDLNTVNGTWLSKSHERIERQTVSAGGEAVVRIGQTVMRLRGNDFVVEPAVSPLALSGPFGRFIENRAIVAFAFLLGFGLYVLMMAQTISKKIIWPDLISTSLSVLIAIALWTGFWSFLSRLVIHSFRFMTHLAIAGTAPFVFILFVTAIEYFEFVFSAPVAAGSAGSISLAVIFSLLLYVHLSVISDLSRWKRMLSSVLLSAAVFGVFLLVSYTKNKEFSNELRFSSVMKPVDPKWVKAVESNEFFGDLEKLKKKIDARARKDRKEESIHK